MRKGKNRYIVEVNDWGCGLMIKDTQTGREIDAPDDEVITLCIKEMNSLAKELDTVRSVAEDNQAELKATRIENARLKAQVRRLEKTGDAMAKAINEPSIDPNIGWDTKYLARCWLAVKEGNR